MTPFLAWGLITSGALLSGTAGAQHPQHGRNVAELQAVLDRWAAKPGRHGVSASVTFRDGSQWLGVAGKANDSTPMVPEHHIWLASITKTMTGAVILQLAQESRLSLNDSVSRWLPSIANVDPSITIQQLLNHTSGVNLYNAGPLFRRFPDSTRVFTAEELASTIGAPLARPGITTRYSNTAFVLLGWIAERASGKTLLQLYHERLWDPRGLGEMFFVGREPPSGPVATAFFPDGTGPVHPLANLSRASGGAGAGAVFATARSLGQWGRALFTGSVLSRAMQDSMRTLVPAAGNIPGESGAGLGIRGYHFLGGHQLGHSGGAVLGSTLMVYEPSSDIVVVVLINQGGSPDHFALVPELLAIARRR